MAAKVVVPFRLSHEAKQLKTAYPHHNHFYPTGWSLVQSTRCSTLEWLCNSFWRLCWSSDGTDPLCGSTCPGQLSARPTLVCRSTCYAVLARSSTSSLSTALHRIRSICSQNSTSTSGFNLVLFSGILSENLYDMLRERTSYAPLHIIDLSLLTVDETIELLRRCEDEKEFTWLKQLDWKRNGRPFSRLLADTGGIPLRILTKLWRVLLY